MRSNDGYSLWRALAAQEQSKHRAAEGVVVGVILGTIIWGVIALIIWSI
jgi:hypothetical protein